jgi:coproporphyrinogen III oxidase
VLKSYSILNILCKIQTHEIIFLLWKTESMNDIESFLLNLQSNIVTELEKVETEKGKKFSLNHWSHHEGGGGKTQVIQQGLYFEKGGVNFSHINGHSLPKSATKNQPELEGMSFDAMGISLVLHPWNPYIPTVHGNLRFFMATDSTHQRDPVWWFGGGFDLTPYYPFEEDCIHWHQTLKQACDPYGKANYPLFKQQCDEYFYLKHRQESRGIGGIFFDDLNEWPFETCFDFIKSLGNGFLEAYLPIVHQRKEMPYGEKERQFQAIRRGRYVEFNLIYDRGTLFGLQLGGRTESILMSLPPLVSWPYDWQPEKNSPEEKLTSYFLKPKNWIDLESNIK